MRLRKELDELQEKDVLLIAQISDALAHPARIKIFRFIMAQNKKRTPVCNKDLVAEFGYAQATISQHMKVLVRSGLVDVKNEERFAYYYANLGVLMKYTDAVKKYSIV